MTKSQAPFCLLERSTAKAGVTRLSAHPRKINLGCETMKSKMGDPEDRVSLDLVNRPSSWSTEGLLVSMGYIKVSELDHDTSLLHPDHIPIKNIQIIL